MVEQSIQLEASLAQFLENYEQWGYDSKNALAVAALDRLRRQLLRQQELMASAELYAEVYEDDEELQELTESASNDIEES